MIINDAFNSFQILRIYSAPESNMVGAMNQLYAKMLIYRSLS